VSGWVWLLLAVALLVVSAWYLSSLAGRLDRLHRRVDAGRVSLDGALLRRTAVATEVAGELLPDPSSAALIAEATKNARRAVDADEVSRSVAESELTQVLAGIFDDSESVTELSEGSAGELVEELASACRRVEMSRRFLNDAVRACGDVRQQPLVRYLGLAGHTPWPQAFDMADGPPEGFGIR
jgi:hypothetical protein